MTQAKQTDGVLHATFYVEHALAPAPELGAPAQAESRTLDVIASTPAPDRYGRVVMQDWDLSEYERNPIVLWNHGLGGGFFGGGDPNAEIPIGFGTEVRVADDKLRARLNFVDAAANPVAEKIYQGTRQGSLRAVSIGWIPGRIEELEDGTIVLHGNKLLEISVVATPANPEAGRVDEEARFHASLQSAAKHKKENTMIKLLIASLGLAEGATESDVVTKVKEHVAESASLKVQVAALTSARDTAAAEVLELKAKVVSNDAARIESEVASLVADGEREGKLTPGNKAAWLSLCGGDADGKGVDPARLKACLANLPVLVAVSPTKTPPVGATAGLTEADLKWCAENKVEPATFAANKTRRQTASAGGK